MVTKAKLYLFLFRIQFLAPFLLQGLTWVGLRAWTQNHPQVVGMCPGHPRQLVSQNNVSKKLRPGPPPLKRSNQMTEKFDVH